MGLILPKKIPMGGSIVKILPFFVRFFSVWVRESLCFDPNFDPNLTLTKYFWCL